MEKESSYYNTSSVFSQSPNANPIENLWSLLKIKVATPKPKTIKEFKKAIYKERNDLPTELASRLVWSTKNRVDDLIQSKGSNS